MRRTMGPFPSRDSVRRYGLQAAGKEMTYVS